MPFRRHLGTVSQLPYWQVNVKPQQRSDECPPYLRDLSDKDKRIIGTPEAAFRPLRWDEVCNIIRENRLEDFERSPDQLREYKCWTHGLADDYGSIESWVVRARIRWTEPIKARGRPFQYADDYRIVWNDWPYGVEKRIVHIVVWTKFELQTEGADGDLTPEARAEIDSFVTRTFASRISADNVRWFKNWAGLKSVHGVEHFHVMLFDPDLDFLRDIFLDDGVKCHKAEE